MLACSDTAEIWVLARVFVKLFFLALLFFLGLPHYNFIGSRTHRYNVEDYVVVSIKHVYTGEYSNRSLVLVLSPCPGFDEKKGEG